MTRLSKEIEAEIRTRAAAMEELRRSDWLALDVYALLAELDAVRAERDAMWAGERKRCIDLAQWFRGHGEGDARTLIHLIRSGVDVPTDDEDEG